MIATAYDNQVRFVRAVGGGIDFGETRVDAAADTYVSISQPKPEFICVHKYLGGPFVRTGILSEGKVIELVVPTDGFEYLPVGVKNALSSEVPDVKFKITDSRRPARFGPHEVVIGSVSVKYRSVELSGVDGRLVEVGVPRSIRARKIPKVLRDARVRPIPIPKKLAEFVQKNLVPSLSFQDLITKKEDEEMLTLKVESDGSPEDVNQIVSLAFNTGMVVEMTLPDGSTAKATPAQVLEQQAAPAEVTPEVAPEVVEPHPVLEKEVPADPPSVEPVTEPSAEAAPAETPVEVVESTP